jgi:hypothetical protein
MRSFLWTSIFVLLMFELVLTLILVLPVPRKVRNWICMKVSKLELKKRLRLPLTGIFFALSFALLDTTNYLQQIYLKENGDERQQRERLLDNAIDRHLIKEKEYRTGRNMYLVGFALTLLFVIGRITELMQEHAELEERVERLTTAAATTAAAAATSSTTSSSEATVNVEIEMKPIQSKKKD